MNIFGIGGAELVLIIVIMLVVAGPKRMIRWAYVIGQYVGKFRILWEQMVDMLQDEVDAAGLDVKIPKELPTKATIAKTASDLMKPYTDTIEQTIDEVKKPVEDTMKETSKVVSEAKTASDEAVKDANEAIKEPKKPQFAPPKSGNVAAWTGNKDAPAPDPKPEAENTESAPDNNFGAWSQPKSADQEIEREV